MRDQEKFDRLKDKEYRDAYVQQHVRGAIAMQIRAIRKKLGLNQKKFASLIGTTQSVVSRLENTEYGKVTVQTLLDIAAALDIALNVRFCSYPDFLKSTADVSPDAMAVPNFDESNWDEPEILAPIHASLIVPDRHIPPPVELIVGGVTGGVIGAGVGINEQLTGETLWLTTISGQETLSLPASGELYSETSIPIRPSYGWGRTIWS